jgi:nucleotide-binding universal stress UspA family protein
LKEAIIAETKKILVPIDGSANSDIALKFGIYIARRLGAAISGFHVLDVKLLQGPILTDISGAVGMQLYD